MIDPGSFFLGFSAGAGILLASSWRLVRRGIEAPTIPRRLSENWDYVVRLSRVNELAARQRLELAKLNRAIRRRNRKIANLRIGGDPKREGTPANDVAGPRVASSPRVGGDGSRPLLLSGESVNSTAARGQTSSAQEGGRWRTTLTSQPKRLRNSRSGS